MDPVDPQISNSNHPYIPSRGPTLFLNSLHLIALIILCYLIEVQIPRSVMSLIQMSAYNQDPMGIVT